MVNFIWNCPTAERPDIVITETVTKKVTILELTVSFETNIEAANIRKQVIYNDLKQVINKNGYITEIIPFEIGSRGHITKRNREALKRFSNKKRRQQRNASIIWLKLASCAHLQYLKHPVWRNGMIPPSYIHNNLVTVMQPVTRVRLWLCGNDSFLIVNCSIFSF